MTTAQMTPDYVLAGFGQKMGWGQRPALIIIDLCKAYYTEGSPLDISANAPDVPAAISKLVAAASSTHSSADPIPIIWTQVSYAPGLSDVGLFNKKTRAVELWERDSGERNALLADWLDDLSPRRGPSEVISQSSMPLPSSELVSLQL
ncbi:hypothetical protein C8J56DRAFT_930420 [Mycena floridula]|nr:hypothetical protein C8J56DRAFT_930420 [Mycena floridula]